MIMQDAWRLEKEGKSVEAFRKFIDLPGGEHAAAAVARNDAARFLKLIQDSPELRAASRAQIVQADLLLACGRNDEAKTLYQTLVLKAAPMNWGTDVPGYYPVEPPNVSDSDGGFGQFLRQELAMPYTSGCGSHRDNWLLRRLIAFDLDEDAGREFLRIWEVHRGNTRPYAVMVDQFDDKHQKTGEDKMLVRPSGFNSLGLQFALDYAFFLKQGRRTNEALNVLLEPLRVMDMDRDPNVTIQEPLPENLKNLPVRTVQTFSRWGFGPGATGVARTEYIRLTLGEFKAAGREESLIAVLRKQIEDGDNRARRVLAQVRLHQGLREDALKLELEYIQNAGFDARTVACRRGMIFEEYQKTADAVAEFEKALEMKSGVANLPDAGEQISEAPHLQARATLPEGIRQGRGSVFDAAQLRDRLIRLYAAEGRTDKAMELELAQVESDENRLGSLSMVEQLARRFVAAGQEAKFNEWARQIFAAARSPRVRANLAWQLKWVPAAITNAASAVAQNGYYGRKEWGERFARLGRDQEREFLRAVVAANPRDAVTRLELLDMEDRVEGPEFVAALETLLATDAGSAFPRGKGEWNRTRFHNYLDLAYRLMRLYEKDGQLDKLRALGLRLARGEKPFEKYDVNLYWSLGENGLEDFGNACLALTIQHADDKAFQEQLAAALKTSRWSGARVQLERRMGTEPRARSGGGGMTNSWVNLSPDVRVIASGESVTCVARGDRFVYSGQPWGVAVYDFKGSAVTRVLLGCEVTSMVVTQQQVWAGTPEGLFRIDAGSWSVAREPIGIVTALALDGGELWIGTRERVFILDRSGLQLRSFSPEEFGAAGAMPITRFTMERDGVWADGREGLFHYDRTGGTWNAVENPGSRGKARLIGIIDGEVWADVYLDDTLRHRIARVDRRTLRVSPVQLVGNLTTSQRMINDPLSFIGRDDGRLAFLGWGQRYVLDATTNVMRRLPETESGVPRGISDPLPEGLLLPDGTLVRAGMPGQPDGGLFFVNAESAWKRVSRTASNTPVFRRVSQLAWPDGLRSGIHASAWADKWPSDAVWAVVFDEARQQQWLCVGDGLALLRNGDNTLRHFGVAEGVGCGPVLDGVALNGKLYFASGWENARGALLTYDPGTGVFTPRFRSDGMDADKVVGLGVKEGRLELRYGVEYQRYHNNDNQRYRQCRPGLFDPASGRFTSGGAPEFLAQDAAEQREKVETVCTLPCLGGPAWKRYEHGGATWICGNRGLVVYSGREAPGLAIQPMQARPVPNLVQELREEAKRVSIPHPITGAQLQVLAAHTNRYVRANALAAAMQPVMDGAPGFVPVLARCVQDPYRNARATAVWLLSRSTSTNAIPPLRLALGDGDAGIRALAALSLAKRGVPAPLDYYDEIIRRPDGYGNYPYGADSSIGVEVDAVHVYASLATNADRAVFEFLVRRPPPNHEDIKLLYPALGASLRRHPDAADVLLAVQDTEKWRPLGSFVQAIFKEAGPAMLPVLHRALASQDRVVRSNAARACGSIGDPSSIPYLIQALDMESGLARASIVWALGQLKAREALPRLTDLYFDARNAADNNRVAGGFLAQQAVAFDRAAYTSLRNLDAIGSDWDELKASARRRPLDPRRDEVLITPEMILDAVREIGPGESQAFYRALSGAREGGDRIQAAVGLGAATGPDQERSREILRNLGADPDLSVRISAAVSLVLMGDTSAETFLLERLKHGDNEERGELLTQLGRLPKARLEPFKKELEAITANEREPEYLRSRARTLVGLLQA